MLRKSFLAFFAILFLFDCFVFLFFFHTENFDCQSENYESENYDEEASIGGEIGPPGRVFWQPFSHGSQHCPLGLPTHLFAHC